MIGMPLLLHIGHSNYGFSNTNFLFEINSGINVSICKLVILFNSSFKTFVITLSFY